MSRKRTIENTDKNALDAVIAILKQGDTDLCLVCGQMRRYATRHYRHEFDMRYLKLGNANCKPQRLPGDHICWYCGIHEKDVKEDGFVTHDMLGDGIHTCVPPAPPGKSRCRNCHSILDEGEDHWHDFDQGGYWKC